MTAESRALTGLRGLAALLVVAHHLCLHLDDGDLHPGLRWLFLHGYLGVDLFFVLSGFVISMVYGAWFTGAGGLRGAAYVRFLLRRVARIWPLHAFVLLVLIGTGTGAAVLSPQLVAANLVMVQAWGLSIAINPPAWSVSTEFLAYLLFPGLAMLGLRGRWGAAVLALSIPVLLAICITQAPVPVGAMRRGPLDIYFNNSTLPALRCLAGFSLGLLTWRAGRSAWVRRAARHPWSGPAGLAAATLLALGGAPDLFVLALLPPIVLGMHFGSGPVQALLACNPVHGIGVLSYAIYLVHYTLLYQIPFQAGPLPGMIALYLAGLLALAYLAFAIIERPTRSFIRHYGERLSAPLHKAAQ